MLISQLAVFSIFVLQKSATLMVLQDYFVEHVIRGYALQNHFMISGYHNLACCEQLGECEL
jgi:hypothetical protein